MMARRADPERPRKRRQVTYIAEPHYPRVSQLIDRFPKLDSLVNVIDAALSYYLPDALEYGIDAHFLPLTPSRLERKVSHAAKGGVEKGGTDRLSLAPSGSLVDDQNDRRPEATRPNVLVFLDRLRRRRNLYDP